ncbi:hypothetical protein K1T71_002591 [Dendrolimus kikuchii]|uniref:Uncharacterized protein n=1 Tax=Dendrolimus kikuchii TaxID=765133 RepID=A0ACC1DDQ1_9NEOP|nr:hypothetical protein K1T71_002591 [Dendrolimus kikuchii]
MYRPSPHNMRNPQWRSPSGLHESDPWRKPTFGQSRPSTSNYINGNEDHWCETCDRGFPTFNLLQKHKGQHQKCNIDGCQFIAHPKVITRHIQMQHSSGLYKKIAKLDNPEEIQKWREERKKKYPTKCTIEKKAAEIKEKIDRGEKMGLKHGRRNSDYKTGIGKKRRNGFHNLNKMDFKRKKSNTSSAQNSNVAKPKPPTQRKPKVLPTMQVKRKLQPFSGIQNIVPENCTEDDDNSLSANDLIEDEDFETINLEANAQRYVKPGICGALSSLICDYGSSDDESNGQPNDKCIIESESKKTDLSNAIEITNGIKNTVKIDTPKGHSSGSESLAQKSISKNVDNKSDDDSGPEEIKTNKSAEKVINKEEEIRDMNKLDCSSKNVNKKLLERSHIFMRPKVKLPSTLLTKLLRREMQQERNIVLQCIRHIIKNNYFEHIKTN